MKEKSNETKGNQPKKNKKVLATLLSLGIGALLGVLVLWTIGFERRKGMEVGEFLFAFFAIFVSIFVWFFLHATLHESGHLVCGLLSGYKFCFFRVGRFTLAKYPDGMKLKIFSIPGTGGQCAMTPPAYNDGNFPFRLYLSGGYLVNLVSAVILFVLFVMFGPASFVGRMFVLGSVVALYLAIVNAIPFQSDMPNDGCQIRNMTKDCNERRAMWELLDFNARLQQGTRVKEFEKDWEAKSNKELVAQCEGAKGISELTMRYSYLFDCERFAEAEDLISLLLEKGISVDLYRKLFLGEALYLELLLHGRKEEIEKLATKEVLSFLTATASTLPSSVRTVYAYEKLYHHDEKALAKAEKKFANVVKNYPNLGELKQEQMLKEKVDEVAKQRTEQE